MLVNVKPQMLAGGSEGDCSVRQFPWCKYFHNSQLQVITVKLLNYRHSQLSRASTSGTAHFPPHEMPPRWETTGLPRRRPAGSQLYQMTQVNTFSHQTPVLRNSLAVQWLGPCALTARGPGSIFGRATKILQAARPKEKTKQLLFSALTLTY